MGERGRAWPVAAALATPALALSLLAVPGVRAGLLEAGGGVLAAEDLRPVAVQQPGTGRRAARGWGTTVYGASSPVTVSSGTIGRGRSSVSDRIPQRPLPMGPPPPPEAPWAASSPAVADREPAALPPVELGPVQRLRESVAAGEGVLLPAGAGVAHLLCSGPDAPRATYQLDDSGGAGTTVHRVDGSGTYDLYYRRASRSYRQTEPCA